MVRLKKYLFLFALLLLVFCCSKKTGGNNAPKIGVIHTAIDSIKKERIEVRITNQGDEYCSIIPWFSFGLSEPSEGYIEAYKTAPHGSFFGYELAPWNSVVINVDIEPNHGSFDYELGGVRVYPSVDDEVFLSVRLKAAYFSAGKALTLDENIVLQESIVDEYLGSSSLEEIRKESEISDEITLPPLDD